MTVIGVTGSNGFFGWHLKCRLMALGYKFVSADRHTFSRNQTLDDFINAVDIIVHIAGVNRASEDNEIINGNIGLAEKLVYARQRVGKRINYVYANSIKARETGPYGHSKAKAASILKNDAKTNSSLFVDILFPHLFGEYGKPHYNSCVSTFAHELVLKQESMVSEGQLELLHVQDAAQIVINALDIKTTTQIVPKGKVITVEETYLVLSRMADYAHTGIVPEINDDIFELRLFNTIRSQMWPDCYPIKLKKHADSRGAFFEVVRARGQGQTSISTTNMGVVRGEHFHFDKVERFSVVSGHANIRVRRLFTEEIVQFEVSGDEPCFIDIPTLCTHDITNIGGSELVTLFWSHDHFDPNKSDTFSLKVTGLGLPA